MAGVIALLYGLCIVTPPIAFAMSDGSQAAHCLTADHGLPTAAMHIHGDYDHSSSDLAQGVASHSDQSSNDQHDKNQSHGQCCGLFCLSALSSFSATVSAPIFARAILALGRPDIVRGQVFLSLLRPPIPSSSVALS